jgi:hypothetical protein
MKWSMEFSNLRGVLDHADQKEVVRERWLGSANWRVFRLDGDYPAEVIPHR